MIHRVVSAVLIVVLGCGTARAFDASAIQGGPDLSGPRAAIAAKDYAAAVATLRPIAAATDHADAYSLLGFALRKSGHPDEAMAAYDKALTLNPDHRGALEYQGELFVQLGQTERARQNLVRLDTLCPAGCEEQEDLQEAIEHAPDR